MIIIQLSSQNYGNPESVVRVGVLQRGIYYLKWKLLSFAKVKWAFWLAPSMEWKWYEKMVSASSLHAF